MAKRQNKARTWKLESGSGMARLREAMLEAKIVRGTSSCTRKETVVQGQRSVLPGPTVYSPIILPHPEITAGPFLQIKRFESRHWDKIHNKSQGQKRDSAQCPALFISCAVDLNGGCCPADRICGLESCLPNTSSTAAFACGRANYIACVIAEGGECCPYNYICATDGCIPSPGAEIITTCGVASYLCPAEVNYGCCGNGMACALNGCYSTNPITFTLTQTTKSIDSNSVVHTITTVLISQTIIGAPSTTAPLTRSIVTKEMSTPTPIAKTTPTIFPSPGTALTKPEFGGIIGGAVFLLLLILIAAFMVVRKLNKSIMATESRRSGATSGDPRLKKLQLKFEQQDIDAMSVDPLMMIQSEASRSTHRLNNRSTLYTTTHELASPNSLPAGLYPFRTESPDIQTAHRYGVTDVSPYSDPTSDAQEAPEEITPPLHQSNNTYFNHQSRPSPQYTQISPIPSQHPNQHIRNWSNDSSSSAITQNSDTALLQTEERKSSAAWNFDSLRRSFGRKNSNPPVDRLDGTENLNRKILPRINAAEESRMMVREGITNAHLREISLSDQSVRYERTGTLNEMEEESEEMSWKEEEN